MIDFVLKPENLTVRRLIQSDWEDYRDYYKSLQDPSHFRGLMLDQDLEDPETYKTLFAATIDKDTYVMFGIWNGSTLIAQTSLFFETKDDRNIAVFAGSERADAYDAPVPYESVIDEANEGLTPNIAKSMRVLYIMTEPGNHEEAKELITAALRKNAVVSHKVVHALGAHGLVNTDGTIPDDIKIAVQDAVLNSYLVLDGPKGPRFNPPSPRLG